MQLNLDPKRLDGKKTFVGIALWALSDFLKDPGFTNAVSEPGLYIAFATFVEKFAYAIGGIGIIDKLQKAVKKQL